MSILVRYSPGSMTTERYDAVSDQIEGALDWPPDGLDLHVCFGSDGDLRVSEVWDSKEQFEAFGQKLMPLLAEGGIEMSGEPEIIPVHRVEKR